MGSNPILAATPRTVHTVHMAETYQGNDLNRLRVRPTPARRSSPPSTNSAAGPSPPGRQEGGGRGLPRLARLRGGGLAERSKAHAWKACRGATPSRVRTPQPPPRNEAIYLRFRPGGCPPVRAGSVPAASPPRPGPAQGRPCGRSPPAAVLAPAATPRSPGHRPHLPCRGALQQSGAQWLVRQPYSALSSSPLASAL
jgi:hypothetical protein